MIWSAPSERSDDGALDLFFSIQSGVALMLDTALQIGIPLMREGKQKWFVFFGLIGFCGMISGTAAAQTLSTKDGLQISLEADGTLQEVTVAKTHFRGVGGFFVAELTEPDKLRWTPTQGKTERKGNALTLQAGGLSL